MVAYEQKQRAEQEAKAREEVVVKAQEKERKALEAVTKPGYRRPGFDGPLSSHNHLRDRGHSILMGGSGFDGLAMRDAVRVQGFCRPSLSLFRSLSRPRDFFLLKCSCLIR